MGRFRAGWLSQIGIGAELPDPEPGAPSVAVPLHARLPVGELAADAVAVLAAAMESARAARLGARRAASPGAAIRLDPQGIADSFRSDQLGRLDGKPFPAWAPLSGFFAAGDGWLRTHANYPWHAAALAGVLGIDAEGPNPAARAAEVIRERSARELERAVFAAGGLAVAVRDADTWAAERAADQRGTTAAGRPVAGFRVTPSEQAGVRWPAPQETADVLPLAGVRVLDLTRVIAGPTGTRALASLGADVLRVDAPGRAEPFWQWLDTGRGKRSTLLDLRARADLRTLRELASTADVVVCGARPGALAHAGFDPDQLVAEYPSAVIASVAAWGPGGAWGSRRGFDSLVQAASGIALIESDGSGAPGKLPAQALDHSAGALIASGVLGLLARGTGGRVETVLEGIALALLRVGRAPAEPSSPRGSDPGSAPRVEPSSPCAAEPGSVTGVESAASSGPKPARASAPTAWGELLLAGPPYRPAWQPEPEPWAGHAWGADQPVWLD